jgi:hydrogenase maturation factor
MLMGLAVPARVVRIEEPAGARVGLVDCAGVTRRVSLSLAPGAVVGDIVSVYGDRAIRRLDGSEASTVLGPAGPPDPGVAEGAAGFGVLGPATTRGTEASP